MGGQPYGCLRPPLGTTIACILKTASARAKASADAPRRWPAFRTGGGSSWHARGSPAQAIPLRGACREYLRQLNLYRARTWTCASTGQGGLTYEEALTSEARQRSLSQVRGTGGTGVLHNLAEARTDPLKNACHRSQQFKQLAGHGLTRSVRPKSLCAHGWRVVRGAGKCAWPGRPVTVAVGRAAQVPATLVQPILLAVHHATVSAEQLLVGLGSHLAASVPQAQVRKAPLATRLGAGPHT